MIGKPGARPLAITERTSEVSGTPSRRNPPAASVFVSGTLSLLTSRPQRTTAEATALPSGPTIVPDTVRRSTALAAGFADERLGRVGPEREVDLRRNREVERDRRPRAPGPGNREHGPRAGRFDPGACRHRRTGRPRSTSPTAPSPRRSSPRSAIRRSPRRSACRPRRPRGRRPSLPWQPQFQLRLGPSGRVEEDALALVSGAKRVGLMVGHLQPRGLESPLSIDLQAPGIVRARTARGRSALPVSASSSRPLSFEGGRRRIVTGCGSLPASTFAIDSQSARPPSSPLRAKTAQSPGPTSMANAPTVGRRLAHFRAAPGSRVWRPRPSRPPPASPRGRRPSRRPRSFRPSRNHQERREGHHQGRPSSTDTIPHCQAPIGVTTEQMYLAPIR